MQDNTLIVGCSYISNIKVNSTSLLHGTPGSGNTTIAARTLAELANNNKQYRCVVVLWSGINRLDCPINLNKHDIEQTGGWYPFVTTIGDIAWYHSGGIIGAWQDNNYACPTEVRNYFTAQYKGATARYLSDLSLRDIVGVQHFLEAHGIEYKMGFIYDIHSVYDRPEQGHLASVCGQIDKSSIYYSLVKWDKFEKQTPYEWCFKHGMLDDDQWHWTVDGAKSWFKQVLDIDLKN